MLNSRFRILCFAGIKTCVIGYSSILDDRKRDLQIAIEFLDVFELLFLLFVHDAVLKAGGNMESR